MTIVLLSIATSLLVAWLVWRGSGNGVNTVLAAPIALLLITVLPALVAAAIGRRQGWGVEDIADTLPMGIVIANMVVWGAIAYFRLGGGRDGR